jgi:hypothetical protein
VRARIREAHDLGSPREGRHRRSPGAPGRAHAVIGVTLIYGRTPSINSTRRSKRAWRPTASRSIPATRSVPHEVCSSVAWLNGQSLPLEKSYHPNVKGQEEFTTLSGQ